MLTRTLVQRSLMMAALMASISAAPAQDPPPAGVPAPGIDVVVLGEIVRTGQAAPMPGREGPAAPLPEGLGEALQAASWLSPDLVVTTGNLLSAPVSAEQWEAQADALAAAMGALPCPWRPVPGVSEFVNSDPAWSGPAEAYARRFGPLSHSFEHGFALVVGLWTGEGGAGEPWPERVGWLKGALAGSSARCVLLFCHADLWNTDPQAWQPVHALLAADGRPVTVLASAARTYRDDGVRDGVAYYTLGPVAGDAEDIDAGGPSWPHITLLRVRPERAVPVVLPMHPRRGAPGVLPADWQTGAEVDRVRALGEGGWATVEGAFEAEPGGPFSGRAVITVTNPTDRTARYAMTSASGSGVALSPTRVDGVLAPHASVTWEVQGTGGALAPRRPNDEFRVRLEYPMENGQAVSVVERLRAPVRQRLSGADAAAAGAPEDEGALRLDGRSAIELDVRPEGPFTIEAWVLAAQPRERSAVISNEDTRGVGIYWMYGGEEPRPVGVVHAGGEARTLLTDGPWSWDRWAHVALVYDGDAARFFLNGRLQAQRSGVGELERRWRPLVIGARPTRGGALEGWFEGLIDEVRVSDVARYEADFEPARVFTADGHTRALLHFDTEGTPLGADDSGRGNHGWVVGEPARVTPSGR